MSIQHKGRRMETEVAGEIYGIKRNDLPTEADSRRMSEWLRRRDPTVRYRRRPQKSGSK